MEGGVGEGEGLAGGDLGVEGAAGAGGGALVESAVGEGEGVVGRDLDIESAAV